MQVMTDEIFSRKWVIPILAELHRQRGSKFVTLHKRLGIGTTALRQTLDFLMSQGAVLRNPGYGHPMRPEYVVAEGAAEIARACDELVRAVGKNGARSLVLAKWAVPTLVAIADGRRRFGELREAVGGVTSRALAMFLKQAQAAGAVRREIVDGYPPSPEYRLTAKAERLVPILRRLA